MEAPATAEELINELRELDRRTIDGLDVALWWVAKTLKTFVTVEDRKGLTPGEPTNTHYIEVPDGVSPNEVYQHPFMYMVDGKDGKNGNGTAQH